MATIGDRCSARSDARDEVLAGTASTIPRWILVESSGPWGIDAPADARLPDGVGTSLRELGRSHHARVLLIRRADRERHPDGVTCIVVDARGPSPWIGRQVVPSIRDVVAVDPDDRSAFDPVEGPVAVVCTHGKRDACCAERGRPLALATAAAFPDATWESTHVGGDRFAANMVLFPHALYFGRVEAVRGPDVVREYAEGRIVLERFRGRATVPMFAQAAEHHVRTVLDLRAVEEAAVVGGRFEGDEGEVRVRASGVTHVVRVRRRWDAPMRLTCRSAVEEPPVRWEVVSEAT